MRTIVYRLIPSPFTRTTARRNYREKNLAHKIVRLYMCIYIFLILDVEFYYGQLLTRNCYTYTQSRIQNNINQISSINKDAVIFLRYYRLDFYFVKYCIV